MNRPRPSRRAFLGATAAAALAPLAVAQETPPAAAPPPAAAAPPADPLKDIREFRVPLGTEPAFVFRALPPAAATGGSAR